MLTNITTNIQTSSTTTVLIWSLTLKSKAITERMMIVVIYIKCFSRITNRSPWPKWTIIPVNKITVFPRRSIWRSIPIFIENIGMKIDITTSKLGEFFGLPQLETMPTMIIKTRIKRIKIVIIKVTIRFIVDTKWTMT